MSSTVQILDAKWYTTMSNTIGIVLVNTQGGHKAYIGTAPGWNEELDRRYISDHGARFHHAPALWPDIKDWAY